MHSTGAGEAGRRGQFFSEEFDNLINCDSGVIQNVLLIVKLAMH